jgi:epoxyqueuosine reductase
MHAYGGWQARKPPPFRIDMSLKKAIQQEAHRLGFELVGVTSPDPPPHFRVFEAWLQAGRQAEMAYLETERSRQRRGNPRQILPECRSILVLGIHYPPPSQHSQASERGQTAAYACSDDYHELLPPRLQALVAFIEAQIGEPVPNRYYTDTGPILERDLAQRAGLGWIGKNTCLIHPARGSYLLLAEILLGIDLEPDPPFTLDHCGNCTRCLQACPTACILPDRTIDANRCISYLTIELKGAIPVELRPKLGNWVFGCDICQQVCPWNQRFAAPANEDVFVERPDAHQPDLIAALELNPQDFNRKFKGTPIKRAKRRGFLRNVAVALGNSGDPQAVPALIRALSDDPEPLVRQHAAWALGQIASPAGLAALRRSLQNEQHPAVRVEIKAVLPPA